MANNNTIYEVLKRVELRSRRARERASALLDTAGRLGDFDLSVYSDAIDAIDATRLDIAYVREHAYDERDRSERFARVIDRELDAIEALNAKNASYLKEIVAARLSQILL